MSRRKDIEFADSYLAMKWIIDNMPSYSVNQCETIERESASEYERVAAGALRIAKHWMARHGEHFGGDAA